MNVLYNIGVGIGVALVTICLQRNERDIYSSRVEYYRALQYVYIKFKRVKLCSVFQLGSVAGSVIQASGRLVFVDGLRLGLTAACRFMLNRRPH